MNHRTSGFTLIELLVVISVIALLIAILLPALRAARDSARAVACMSNQRQLGISFGVYLNDNDGEFPPYYNSQISDDRYFQIWWPARMVKETALQTPEIFSDPAFTTHDFPDFGDIDVQGPASSFHTRLAWSHYGYNGLYLGSSNQESPRPTEWTAVTARVAGVRNPSDTVAMMDTQRRDLERGYCVAYDIPHTFNGIARHRGAVNVLWADQHASAVRVRDPREVLPELPGRLAPSDAQNVWDRD